MAEHHPLQYWLESLNLPQYYLNFSQHGILTKSECCALDEQRLTDIGITMPGHQRRILSHLHTWPESITPILPPKKKSARDSFLLKDNFQAPTEASQNQSILITTKDGALLYAEESNRVKTSPKPVPRPRSNKPKSPVPPNEDKPKPAPRPTPAPRKQSFPQGFTESLQENNVEQNQTKTQTESVNSTSKKDESSVYEFEDDVNIETPIYELEPEVDLNSTYSKVNKSQETYAVVNKSKDARFSPISTTNYENCRSNGESDNIGNSSVSTIHVPLDGACVGETATEDDEIAVADDIYENLEGRNDITGQSCGITNLKSSAQLSVESSCSKSSASASPSSKRRDYVNVDLDAVSKAFKTSDTQRVNENETDIKSVTDNTKHNAKDEKSDKVKENIEQIQAHPEADDCIYEPIWGDNKPEVKGGPSVRSSNLMIFSPLDRSNSPDSSSRLSTLFNMPPPGFPPPPLPPGKTSREDLSDFDPLAVPVIPPRPANYHLPRFKAYENVSFHSSGGSTTLPGLDQNMEPDRLNTPNSLGYEDAAMSATTDPFSNVDPFGEFTPDDSGFSPGTLPPMCYPGGPEGTFINPQTGSSFGISRQSDAIYEVAEEPFDPFGLNSGEANGKPGETDLTRSISSGSGNSGLRLSEVPPAPKWPHTIPEGRWMQKNDERVYSLANDISK